MEALKKEIETYWAGREEKFEALRLDELNSEKRGRWLDELRRYLPLGRKLDILDIGTGTGFFSFLLAAEGHNVTGIDLTGEMIAGAKRYFLQPFKDRDTVLFAGFHAPDSEKLERYAALVRPFVGAAEVRGED